VARFSAFQAGRSYLRDRTVETLGVLYGLGWPNREFASARGARRLPLHERHLAAGAVMGQRAGWEIPLVFAPSGEEARIELSYGRQNWVPWAAAECREVERGLALFDLSAGAKLELSGSDAGAVLDRLAATPSSSELATALWLNERGRIEAELSILPLADERFLILSAPGAERLHERWIKRHSRPAEAVSVEARSSAYAAFLLVGPQARVVLAAAGARGLAEARPVRAEIGYAPAIIARTADLGAEAWLVLVSTDFAAHLVESLAAASPQPLRFGGAYAVEALRIEAGQPAWPSELGGTVTPFEAGLAARLDRRKADFIGREALLAAEALKSPRSRLVRVEMQEDRLALYGQETILRDGKPVGMTSSGSWGHRTGAPVALGYLTQEAGVDEAFLTTGRFALDLPGGAKPVRCSLI
jgi:4-methylaminobutanoate oxidase (formaldehyde-forming)